MPITHKQESESSDVTAERLLDALAASLSGDSKPSVARNAVVERKLAILAKFQESSPHDMDMITPQIYVGNRAATWRESELQRLGVTHILTVDEEPLPKAAAFIRGAITEQFEYMHVRIVDEPHVELLSSLPKCLDFIESAITKGAVLVHCDNGLSRSVAIVIAYIMAKERKSFDAVHSLVEDIRPTVYMNESFREQLTFFGKTLKWKIDESSQLYRGYQWRLIAEKIKDGAQFEELVPATSLGKIDRNSRADTFCCMNCKQALFDTTHLVAHAGVDSTTSCMHRLYVEPMRWFSDLLKASTSGGGMLNCPGCNDIVGSYNWFGTNCTGCRELVLPAFQMFPFKLELVRK